MSRRLCSILVVALFLGAASTAAAVGPATLITRSSLGNARLGLQRADYSAQLGRTSFMTRYGNGLTRLTFRRGTLHVYLAASTHRGVALMTSDESYRTPAGVGPCSSATRLRRAYGRLLAPIRLGRDRQLVGYRLGSLVFVVSTRRVRLVMLSTGSFPIRLAVNSAACGIGEEGK